VRGRIVDTLIDAELRPGSHQAVWDGRDWKGRTMASGVFLIRLSGGRGEVSTTVTLLK